VDAGNEKLRSESWHFIGPDGQLRSGRSDLKAPIFVHVYGGKLRKFDFSSTWCNVRTQESYLGSWVANFNAKPGLRPRICRFLDSNCPARDRSGSGRDRTLSDSSRPPAGTDGGTRGGTGVGSFMPDFRWLDDRYLSKYSAVPGLSLSDQETSLNLSIVSIL
jgi:hypothetical protein